jgi:hypothetical protein
MNLIAEDARELMWYCRVNCDEPDPEDARRVAQVL